MCAQIQGGRSLGRSQQVDNFALQPLELTTPHALPPPETLVTRLMGETRLDLLAVGNKTTRVSFPVSTCHSNGSQDRAAREGFFLFFKINRHDKCWKQRLPSRLACFSVFILGVSEGLLCFEALTCRRKNAWFRANGCLYPGGRGQVWTHPVLAFNPPGFSKWYVLREVT